MANNTYTLKLAIDPSNLFGGQLGGNKKPGGGGGNSKSLIDAMFGSGNPLKGLAKLGLISAGVIGILDVLKKLASKLVDVSPILQSMMKLFNTSITFLLRPLADFIRFFLRPIMIHLLRYIALPFYRFWMPLGRKLGTFLGTPIGNLVKTIGTNQAGAVGGGIAGAGAGAIVGAKVGAVAGFNSSRTWYYHWCWNRCNHWSNSRWTWWSCNRCINTRMAIRINA